MPCGDRYHAVTQPCSFGAVGGGDTGAFVVPSATMLERSLWLSLPVQLLRRAHEDSDHTVVIAVVHWRLHVETHRAGTVVSTVTMFCLPFGCHCRFDRLSMVIMWCALNGTSCNTWFSNGYQECSCPSFDIKKKNKNKASSFSHVCHSVENGWWLLMRASPIG